MRITITTLLFSVLLVATLQAQEVVYDIQLAIYAAPDYERFAPLFNTGYVFTKSTDNDLYRVLMGTYSSKKLAQQKLAAVKKKGFKDAFLVKRTLKEEDAVYIVQLATYDQQADVYWSDWQRLSTDLVVQLSDDKMRVASGPFYTRTKAEKALALLQSRGPKDIFIKKVSEEVLHQASDFDFKHTANYGRRASSRLSVRALQELLTTQQLYDVPPNGSWTSKTSTAIEEFKTNNESYKRHQTLAKNSASPYQIEQYTLQYYVNSIPDNPNKAAEGLKQFQNPIAKIYLAYLYFNEDVAIDDRGATVNRLMNEATETVFKGYRGETRYDFSLKYAYEDLEQLLRHLKAVYEVLKTRPDMPCWLLERHPRAVRRAFDPYWNNSRDDYTVSNDCGSFLDLPEMKVLRLVSEEFAANKQQQQTLMDINRLYVMPRPIPYQEIEGLERWNGRLWNGLKKLQSGSPLESNMYTVLRFSYYDALRVLEDRFIDKGMPASEARSLGLKVLKAAVGPNLTAYIH